MAKEQRLFRGEELKTFQPLWNGELSRCEACGEGIPGNHKWVYMTEHGCDIDICSIVIDNDGIFTTWR